jgi:integrase
LQAVVAILATTPENARRIQVQHGAFLEMHLFDVLRFKGRNVTHQPLYERLSILDGIVRTLGSQYIKAVPTGIVGKRAIHDRVLQMDGEGTVWKRLDQPYEVSLRKKPRSAHTVRGYMTCVLAAMNWAYLQGWLPTVPKLRKIKTSKQKSMKGRPISVDEFQKMLEATAGVVGELVTESWKHVLRGLWESALRLDELMHVSWDKPRTIRPVWKEGQLAILDIPAAMQKNDTEECIPLLPWFEAVLLETPPEKRTGWVFDPQSLQLKLGRKIRHQRPDAEWVGKVIARIGKKAGIVVESADERTGRPIKYATAHDLRRSCGERLRDAGVPPLVICSVMRHSSWETTRKHYAPGDIQKDAEVLRAKLAVPPRS